MSAKSPNIYQKARYDSPDGLTQEKAAELLFVSVKTVKAWEQGLRDPEPRTVFRMSEIYKAPWLCLEYAQMVLQELRIFPDGVHTKALPTAVLSLDNCTRQMMDDYRTLLRIAADGRIDEDEQADFEQVKQTIARLIVSGLQVIYHYDAQGTKEERPMAATMKRSMSEEKSTNDCNISLSHPRTVSRPILGRTGGAAK